MLNLGGRNVGGSAPCDGVNNNNKKLLLFRCDAMRCDAMRCDAMLGAHPPYFLLSKHFTHMYSVCSPTFVRSISHLCSHFEYICSSACLISC